jgi:hypothetical protein
MSRSWLSVGRGLACQTVAAAVVRHRASSAIVPQNFRFRVSGLLELAINERKKTISKDFESFSCRFLSIHALRLPL